MPADPRRVKELFGAALDLADAPARQALLDRECSNDPEVRRRVEILLAAHDQPESVLERPLAVPAGPATDTFRPRSETVGTVIADRYKLLEPIGEGGMGTVWMAQQTEPVKRTVAVKLIKPGMESKQVLARFGAERQALALMDHPNIARVLDGGATDAGRPYFVMDLVKGVPITRYCDEHHLTPRQRLELFVPVCQAVQHAHQKGIIHRDLKPSNVLVAQYDGKPVPKVIDFGVAKAAGQALTDKTLITGFGNIVGTLEYMSPEQAEVNQLDIDTRSDIYSLGVLLYELLAGSTPFTKKDLEKAGMLEMLRVIREDEPSKPSTKLSSSDALPTLSANRGTEPAKLTKLVRGELDWIVMKALEKDRNRRYETANGFAADVQRYLADEPVQACPPSASYRVRKFTRRNKRALAGAAVLGLAILAVAGTLGWAVRDRESRAQEAARDRAAQQATTAARVGQVLDESENLYRRRKLPEATQLARNALALADGGAGGPEVERRAREWLNDLDMVVRLEETHARTDLGQRAKLDESLQALREYGIDIEALPPEEAAARIAARPTWVDLAASLDRWGMQYRFWGDAKDPTGEKDAALRARLGQIARLADPDPLRNQVRELHAAGQPGDPGARELAAKVDLATTPIVTLMLIDHALVGKAHGWREMLDFLSRVHQQHPGNFDVAIELARLHRFTDAIPESGSGFTPADLDRAIRYSAAAVALRPTSAAARDYLGYALMKKGLVDEAIAEFRECDRLNPEHAPTSRWYIARALMKKKDRQEEALAMYRELVRADPNAYGYHKSFALALRELGWTDDAIVEFREAIRISPNSAEDYNWLGVVLDDKGSWDKAIAAFREAIRINPNNWVYRKNLGLTLGKKGLPDEAIVAFRETIRLNPKSAEAHSSLGTALRKLNRSDEAIVPFQEAVRLDPKDKYAQNGLGNALSDGGRWDEAIAAYRAALRLDPDDAPFHTNLAHAFLQKGALDEANGAAREAIRLQPNNPRGHLFLARALLEQRRTDEAIASYREAIRLQKDSAESHEGLAEALVQKGQVYEAIAFHKKAIELNPKYVIAHNRLGVLLQRHEKLDEAIACYKKVIEIVPESAIAHNNLGGGLQQRGKLDEAIAEYREAIRLMPDYPKGRRDLDSALAARRTIDEATKAIELKPTDWSSWNQRAWAYFQQKQWDRAVADYSKAIELNPDVHTNWLHRGHAHMALKKWDNAVADFSELLKRFPGDSGARYDRGWARENLGQWGEVVADYSKVIELAPQHEMANRRLAWLLATCPDVKLRDAGRAVELAKKAVLLVPKQGTHWLTLGVARYRVGDWKAATEALDMAMLLRNGGDSNEWFLLAMAHWQLGNKAEVRKWYDKGVEWMDKNQPENKELRRFRAEAAELLGVAVEVGPPPREKK